MSYKREKDESVESQGIILCYKTEREDNRKTIKAGYSWLGLSDLINSLQTILLVIIRLILPPWTQANSLGLTMLNIVFFIALIIFCKIVHTINYVKVSILFVVCFVVLSCYVHSTMCWLRTEFRSTFSLICQLLTYTLFFPNTKTKLTH